MAPRHEGGGGSGGQGEVGGGGSLARSRQIGANHLADGPDPPPTPVGHRGLDPERERGIPRDWTSRTRLETFGGDHGQEA